MLRTYAVNTAGIANWSLRYSIITTIGVAMPRACYQQQPKLLNYKFQMIKMVQALHYIAMRIQSNLSNQHRNNF